MLKSRLGLGISKKNIKFVSELNSYSKGINI